MLYDFFYFSVSIVITLDLLKTILLSTPTLVNDMPWVWIQANILQLEEKVNNENILQLAQLYQSDFVTYQNQNQFPHYENLTLMNFFHYLLVLYFLQKRKLL